MCCQQGSDSNFGSNCVLSYGANICRERESNMANFKPVYRGSEVLGMSFGQSSLA